MGIGFLEICIIAIFALIFFGPQRLPEVMRELGKFFVHTKRLTNEVKGHFEQIMNEAEAAVDADEKKKAAQKALLKAQPAIPVEAAPVHSEAHVAAPLHQTEQPDKQAT